MDDHRSSEWSDEVLAMLYANDNLDKDEWREVTDRSEAAGMDIGDWAKAVRQGRLPDSPLQPLDPTRETTERGERQ